MTTPSTLVPSGTPSLAGRVAVVTGGGRGVGAAIARRLAADGAAVIVAARTRAEIDAVADALQATGARASAIACDVSNPASIEELAASARRLFERVDILVNNAGVAMAAPVLRTTLEEWQTALAVNATSAFLCLKAFLPSMLSGGWGRVVNIASTAALSSDRYIAAYAASKHALLGLTRSAAAEVAAQGVTVNAICPGFLATDMTEQSVARIVAATGRSREETVATLARRNPQNRIIDADEVAAAAAYLCSDAAAGVNGTALVIDGGELRR
jgi:NAD(P)-dependent dehydrogenase (short-subunit alcohol dehydrogenase family)